MGQQQLASVRKLAWVMVIVVMFVIITAALMSSLSSAKRAAQDKVLYSRMSMSSGPMVAGEYGAGGMLAGADGDRSGPPLLAAQVKTFMVEVDLTPRLSVGTERPESIYEAKFHAMIVAVRPAGDVRNCQIRLPLPPQLISLADLSVTVNGDPSDSFSIRGDELVWTGHLDESDAAALEITYMAVGKGIFTLAPPVGRIVDEFSVTIAAHGSDVRMLELSLQPEAPELEDGRTTYVWTYKRLMFGQPIMLDVLGIAPADRLGELTWLGPISVLIFGLLVALAALAYRPEKLDAWTLLLLVGTFAGAYPLMYFAQDFLPLGLSVILSAAIVLVIVGVRATTLWGPALGLLGVVVLGAAIEAVALASALWPHLQGVLLTGQAIGALVVGLILLPRVKCHWPAPNAAAPAPQQQ